jgi:hypothetical protein
MHFLTTKLINIQDLSSWYHVAQKKFQMFGCCAKTHTQIVSPQQIDCHIDSRGYGCDIYEIKLKFPIELVQLN